MRGRAFSRATCSVLLAVTAILLLPRQPQTSMALPRLTDDHRAHVSVTRARNTLSQTSRDLLGQSGIRRIGDDSFYSPRQGNRQVGVNFPPYIAALQR